MRSLSSLLLACALACTAATAAQPGDDMVVEARELLRAKKVDRTRLVALRNTVVAQRHPLAGWVDYWELGTRLPELAVADVEAFYARWPGSYVEDRLRNDWLLELGRRRDWQAFARDLPRFRMNDDRQVTCYGLLTRHLSGDDVAAAARAAWLAQTDVDDGCNLLAGVLFEAGVFKPADAWAQARQAAELNRPRQARAAVALVDPALLPAVTDAFDAPPRLLARGTGPELALLALLRLAAADPDAAAAQIPKHRLPAGGAALAWAVTARHAAVKLQPEALAYVRDAWRALKPDADPHWSDDVLAWQVRAALRAPAEADRWTLVRRAIAAMSEAEQRDPAWVYWKARSLAALAGKDDGERPMARVLLESIAGQLHFYGLLATEDLGQSIALPVAAQPLVAAERDAARSTPGFVRALQLVSLSLRNEGVREWNYTLRGLSDRELLAAAALACEREVWDRCINTSERSRNEVDLLQRFPMPFRSEVTSRTREIGLDPAYVYGLIRQESRFVTDARSAVGASGLMQVMPATARWTAKRIGYDYRPEMATDRTANLALGTGYLKLVLDDFGGSQALAAAAYNAGPGRPRRWREGPRIEAAAWIEGIPFNETRDYVKKVLANAVVYGALIGGPTPSLKTRLAGSIGPRDPAAPASNTELP